MAIAHGPLLRRDEPATYSARLQVRWDKVWVPGAPAGSADDMVTVLFQRVLLEERSAQYGGGGGGVGTFTHGKHTVRWATSSRELGLVLAAVHPSNLVLPYVDDLLTSATVAFGNRMAAVRHRLRWWCWNHLG